jgi:hypothetical protein
MPAQDGTGVTSRCARSLAGRSRVSPARTAQSAQSSQGRGLARRSTATSCRSTISEEAEGGQPGPAGGIIFLYYVLGDLAGEICGARPRYQALAVLDEAAMARWIDGTDGRRPAWVNTPNAELDDEEPVAQALLRLKRIVDQAVAEERSNLPKLGDLLNW